MIFRVLQTNKKELSYKNKLILIRVLVCPLYQVR